MKEGVINDIGGNEMGYIIPVVNVKECKALPSIVIHIVYFDIDTVLLIR